MSWLRREWVNKWKLERLRGSGEVLRCDNRIGRIILTVLDGTEHQVTLATNVPTAAQVENVKEQYTNDPRLIWSVYTKSITQERVGELPFNGGFHIDCEEQYNCSCAWNQLPCKHVIRSIHYVARMFEEDYTSFLTYMGYPIREWLVTLPEGGQVLELAGAERYQLLTIKEERVTLSKRHRHPVRVTPSYWTSSFSYISMLQDIDKLFARDRK